MICVNLYFGIILFSLLGRVTLSSHLICPVYSYLKTFNTLLELLNENEYAVSIHSPIYHYKLLFFCFSMECKRGFLQEWPVFDTFMQIFVYFGA